MEIVFGGYSMGIYVFSTLSETFRKVFYLRKIELKPAKDLYLTDTCLRMVWKGAHVDEVPPAPEKNGGQTGSQTCKSVEQEDNHEKPQASRGLETKWRESRSTPQPTQPAANRSCRFLPAGNPGL